MIELQFEVISPFTGELGFTGPPLRAAFLSLLNECNNELSSEVHDSRQIRSYALQPFPHNSRLSILFEEGRDYHFRVNLLDSEKYAGAIRNIALSNRHDLRIHQHKFKVRRIDFNSFDPTDMMEHWTDEFSNDFDKTVQIVMQFLTPTQLSQYGNDYGCLLPVPERLFSSILRVWNSIEKTTAVAHVSAYRDWIEEHVTVAPYGISTRVVEIGRNRSTVGFVGKAVFTLREANTPLGYLTAGLARFAQLSNVGKNRTAGLGQVEVRVES